MCGYMDQSYLPFLNIVSQKMIPHFYVLRFGMEYCVLCNAYGTGAVTLKWDMGILLTKVTHGVCDPKELRETTSSGNVLCLDSGLSNTRLFAGGPRHQRRSQKLASPRSGLPIQPTPSKIRIRKTMKRQRRGCGVPKAEVGSVTQVPEISLHRLSMRSPRRRLKTSAQTYQELDVRPCRRLVEECPRIPRVVVHHNKDMPLPTCRSHTSWANKIHMEQLAWTVITSVRGG
jgi:hypothetical protein